MKMKLFVSILLIVAVITGCKKSDEVDTTDNIVYKKFDKIVTLNNQDSIPGACKALVFEIINNREPYYSGVLKVNNSMIACDGYNSILTYPGSQTVIPLEDNYLISGESTWSDINNLNLNDFAELDGKYIGYRSCVFPEGTNIYNYGWIKIKLSKDKDVLTIVDQAINGTDNNSIKTGQVQ